MCVCVRERERERGGEGDRERGVVLMKKKSIVPILWLQIDGLMLHEQVQIRKLKIAPTARERYLFTF